MLFTLFTKTRLRGFDHPVVFAALGVPPGIPLTKRSEYPRSSLDHAMFRCGSYLQSAPPLALQSTALNAG